MAAGGTYKSNRTLPLQFRLSFADGTPAVSAVGLLLVEPQSAENTAIAALDVDAGAPPDEGRRFRFTGNHYHFNLNTLGWPAGAYRLSVVLEDGRTHTMLITLR